MFLGRPQRLLCFFPPAKNLQPVAQQAVQHASNSFTQWSPRKIHHPRPAAAAADLGPRHGPGSNVYLNTRVAGRVFSTKPRRGKHPATLNPQLHQQTLLGKRVLYLITSARGTQSAVSVRSVHGACKLSASLSSPGASLSCSSVRAYVPRDSWHLLPAHVSQELVQGRLGPAGIALLAPGWTLRMRVVLQQIMPHVEKGRVACIREFECFLVHLMVSPVCVFRQRAQLWPKEGPQGQNIQVEIPSVLLGHPSGNLTTFVPLQIGPCGARRRFGQLSNQELKPRGTG